VAPKAAGIGFLLRILINHVDLNLTPVLAVLSALTMTVGNIGALHQTNVKRLMAYSSIAQVGYILAALTAAVVAVGDLGSQAVMVYTFLYVFMNLGVFAVLILVSNQTRSDEITTFAGLSKTSFGLAMALAVFLLSLTGIPPMAGFVGKFALFAALMKNTGLVWLGVVAVVNSVISLYYYFRIVREVFFCEPQEPSRPLVFSPALICCVVATLAVTLALGVFPGPFLNWVRTVVGI
jgi:NADH-quinone oxidoreductase subunit N